jgi:hypothetical protein
MSNEVERQWPSHITTGEIRYGPASNYDGFYLADAQHGIPTFGSVSPTEPLTIRGQHVSVFNYPGQTEEIAKTLCDRWNAYHSNQSEIARLRKGIQSAAEEFVTIELRLRAMQMERALGAVMCGQRDLAAALNTEGQGNG